jgi:hypothetical protein
MRLLRIAVLKRRDDRHRRDYQIGDDDWRGFDGDSINDPEARRQSLNAAHRGRSAAEI